MFLLTGFSFIKKVPIPSFFAIYLILAVAVTFFVFKIIELRRERKEEWLDNIPNAVKKLNNMKLSTQECFHLLSQTLYLPKAKDEEKLFMQLCLSRKIVFQYPNITLSGWNLLRNVDESIEKISGKSKFLKRVERETEKYIYKNF